MKKVILTKFLSSILPKDKLKSIKGGYGGGDCWGSVCPASASGCTSVYNCTGGTVFDCKDEEGECISCHRLLA